MSDKEHICLAQMEQLIAEQAAIVQHARSIMDNSPDQMVEAATAFWQQQDDAMTQMRMKLDHCLELGDRLRVRHFIIFMYW